MINVFYLYSVVEILNIIYYLRDYLRNYKKNPNKEHEIIDITNPVDTLKNIDRFGFVMSILSFVWTIAGLFTQYKNHFIILLVITYSFPFFKEKMNPKTAKNIFLINSVLKIIIILFLIYNNIR